MAEVQAPSPELVRGQLLRVFAAPEFVHSERLQAFLRHIVDQSLAGAHDQLKESVIGVEVFGREPGYNPKADAIVRVEAHRLRQKLEQYYAGPGAQDQIRFILPKGRYEVSIEDRRLPPRSHKANWKQAWLFISVALGAVAVLLWMSSRPRQQPQPLLERLTADSGLTTDPVLSPDGRTVVFASDRAGDGHTALWRMPVAGGSAVRLTNDHFDERDPSFSPGDGKFLAFRSEREGGGIYRMPAEGGLPDMLAAGGRRPRWSPAGRWIVYNLRDEHWNPSRLFVVDESGSEPRRIAADFADAHDAIWSPDGTSILFCGTRVSNDPAQEHDWWLLPFPNGEPVKTGAVELFRTASESSGTRFRVQNDPLPALQDWRNGSVIFTVTSNDTQNLWRIRIDGKGQLRGPPDRLTSGTGFDNKASAAPGLIAFSSGSRMVDVWSAPLPAAGKPQPLRRITQHPGLEFQPNVSPDGRHVVYSGDRGGKRNVYLLDQVTGQEVPFPEMSSVQDYACFSPGGKSIAFLVQNGKNMEIWTRPGDAGKPPYRVCEDCGAPMDWTTDGRFILFRTGARLPFLGLVDSTTGQKSVLLQTVEGGIYAARISPDGRWLAFQADGVNDDRHVIVTPFRPQTTQGSLDASTWVEVSARNEAAYSPAWSPDGSVLYFVAERGGDRVVKGRKWDSRRGGVGGEEFTVLPAPGPRQSLLRNVRLAPHRIGLSVRAGQIYFTLDESVANIWLLRMPR